VSASDSGFECGLAGASDGCGWRAMQVVILGVPVGHSVEEWRGGEGVEWEWRERSGGALSLTSDCDVRSAYTMSSTAQHSTARHGTARHGTARHARHGTARHGTARTDGTARHGTARHGTARHGTARTDGDGTARHGTGRTARHGTATARHGTARHGTARHTKSTAVRQPDAGGPSIPGKVRVLLDRAQRGFPSLEGFLRLRRRHTLASRCSGFLHTP